MVDNKNDIGSVNIRYGGEEYTINKIISIKSTPLFITRSTIFPIRAKTRINVRTHNERRNM
ncbi:MAG: hypothetical protein BWX58_01225 [Deltaproteobacteria bacterium ADurb.Bin026]|nr:MAG: hypothetical protein BWX58_01225 [Deltaproteobacteria bacterium ADurb.Bin026]